jgi:hypothetical protein
MDLVHDAIANSIQGIAMDFTISAKIRANMGKYLDLGAYKRRKSAVKDVFFAHKLKNLAVRVL